MEEKTLNQLWFEVTGLIWDVESMLAQEKITEEKLLWLIPDGSMLDFEGRKRSLTQELLSKLDVDDDAKFSTVEVETEEQNNTSEPTNTPQNSTPQDNNLEPPQEPVINSGENTNEPVTNSGENNSEPENGSNNNNGQQIDPEVYTPHDDGSGSK